MKRFLGRLARAVADRWDPQPEILELRPITPEMMRDFRAGAGRFIKGIPQHYTYDRNGDVVYLYPTPDQDFRIYWRGTW